MTVQYSAKKDLAFYNPTMRPLPMPNPSQNMPVPHIQITLSAYAIFSTPRGPKPCYNAESRSPLPHVYLQCQCSEILRLRSKGEKEIPGHFETEPAACHARGHFQKVGYDAFVHASDAFLGDDHTDRIKNTFVLVSYPRHGIDLKAAAKHITITFY